jgi:hypothetical protein
MRFCEQCGRPVTAAPPAYSGSNRGVWLVGLALVALICLLGLAGTGLLLLWPARTEVISSSQPAPVDQPPAIPTPVLPAPVDQPAAAIPTPVLPAPVDHPPTENWVRLVNVEAPASVTAGKMFGLSIHYAWFFNTEGTVGIRAEGGLGTRDAPGGPTLVTGAGEATHGLGKFAPDQPGPYSFYAEVYAILPDGSEIIDRRTITVNVTAAPAVAAAAGESTDYVRITGLDMPPQIPDGVIFGATVYYEWAFAEEATLRIRGTFGNANDAFITKTVRSAGHDSIYLGKHALPQPGQYTFTVDLTGAAPGGPELRDHRQQAIEVVPYNPPTAAPTATPVFQPRPGAVNLFFTIQSNGAPWGYVVDPQGREIRPEPGISSAVTVAVQPGIPVQLHTDAVRFSLLFDCGVDPGSFVPCDFTAAVPADLPAEIRVNQDGGPAFVNVSGPDNWAGQRSGFPGQRYPADPVFRFVLSR